MRIGTYEHYILAIFWLYRHLILPFLFHSSTRPISSALELCSSSVLLSALCSTRHEPRPSIRTRVGNLPFLRRIAKSVCYMTTSARVGGSRFFKLLKKTDTRAEAKCLAVVMHVLCF